MGIRAFIIDDHPLVRAGLTRLLKEETGIQVLGDADSGESALLQLRSLDCNIILLDVCMPGMGGLELIKKMRRIRPQAYIVVVSVCDEAPFPHLFLQAGAMGYILKNSSVKEMVEGIRAVYAGQTYLSPGVAQQLALQHISKGKKNPFETLSRREIEIVLLVVDGLKPVEVARKLVLSPKTVNGYRYRLYRKLRIHSDVELVRLALRYGLVHVEEGL
jgi:two-component system, NarL family, invasion response regulator UvrY